MILHSYILFNLVPNNLYVSRNSSFAGMLSYLHSFVWLLLVLFVCLGKQRPYNVYGQFIRPPDGLQNVLPNGQAYHTLVFLCLLGINLNVYTKPENTQLWPFKSVS